MRARRHRMSGSWYSGSRHRATAPHACTTWSATWCGSGPFEDALTVCRAATCNKFRQDGRPDSALRDDLLRAYSKGDTGDWQEHEPSESQAGPPNGTAATPSP